MCRWALRAPVSTDVLRRAQTEARCLGGSGSTARNVELEAELNTLNLRLRDLQTELSEREAELQALKRR